MFINIIMEEHEDYFAIPVWAKEDKKNDVIQSKDTEIAIINEIEDQLKRITYSDLKQNKKYEMPCAHLIKKLRLKD